MPGPCLANHCLQSFRWRLVQTRAQHWRRQTLQTQADDDVATRDNWSADGPRKAHHQKTPRQAVEQNDELNNDSTLQGSLADLRLVVAVTRAVRRPQVVP